MGTVLRRDNMHRELFEQLSIGFSRMGLRDMVSVFVNDDGVTAITCGLTYDILECIVEGSKDRLTDLFFGIATGTLKDIDFTYDTVICVKLTVPPFPYMTDQPRSAELDGVTSGNLRHMFVDEACETEDGFLCHISTGCILKATAHGRSLREAQRRVYRTLEHLDVKDKSYRIDVGNKAKAVFAT